MADNNILFESFDDMKPFVGGGFGSININSLNSELNNSLNDIAIMTGKTLLSDLVTAFREGTKTDEQDALLPYIQKPLANMCFYRHSNIGAMYISDSGYTVEEGANSKRPWQWMIKNFQKQMLNNYADGMNDLWNYLQDNASDFPAWADTREYKNLQIRPINDLQEWAEAGRRIRNWRTHYALLPEMNMVWQDMGKFISTDLVDEVNDWLENGGSNADIEALMPYIQRYVAHATIARAAASLPVSIEAEGLLINEISSNQQNQDVMLQDRDKQMIKMQAEEEACKAKDRLVAYLIATADDSHLVPYYEAFLENPATPVVLNEQGDKIIIM